MPLLDIDWKWEIVMEYRRKWDIKMIANTQDGLFISNLLTNAFDYTTENKKRKSMFGVRTLRK